jgi:hypothetical protein
MIDSGPVRVGDGWAGVFIAHSEALAYAAELREMLAEMPAHVGCALIYGLVRLLESCDAAPRVPRLEVVD